MRTTLTLDDDLADALKEIAEQSGQPFKKVVNDAIRRGLGPSQEPKRRPYRVRPISSGLRPGIDPLRLKELDDELEVERFLEVAARDSSPN